jgi:hypothetical protein
LATLQVTLNTDALEKVGDGQLTLREAIRYVNGEDVPLGDQGAFDYANLGLPGQIDKIVFAPGLFDANGKAKVTLQHNWEPSSVTGGSRSGLEVRRSVVIEAPLGKEVEIAAGANNTTYNRRVLEAFGASFAPFDACHLAGGCL